MNKFKKNPKHKALLDNHTLLQKLLSHFKVYKGLYNILKNITAHIIHV